jgi:hypothetical protein
MTDGGACLLVLVVSASAAEASAASWRARAAEAFLSSSAMPQLARCSRSTSAHTSASRARSAATDAASVASWSTVACNPPRHPTPQPSNGHRTSSQRWERAPSPVVRQSAQLPHTLEGRLLNEPSFMHRASLTPHAS